MTRIAVTYEDGKVFQHFGHAENFKVYTVSDGEVKSTQMLAVEGRGHEAVAAILVQNAVDVVICGGLGDGANEALENAGIVAFSGAEGDVDDAVAAFLAGELMSEGVNCDHHGADNVADDEEGGCGCGGSCGDGGCGGCGGGCGGCGGGAPQMPVFEGPNVGKKVRAHYRGTFNDGSQFDSSYDRGEPLEFICGAGMMIYGFDKAVATMEVGQIVDVHLMPEEAYGPSNPNAILNAKIADMPGSEDLSVGDRVYLSNMYGQQIPVTVTFKDETNITFDANHEMAGKELNFTIELVEVM